MGSSGDSGAMGDDADGIALQRTLSATDGRSPRATRAERERLGLLRTEASGEGPSAAVAGGAGGGRADEVVSLGLARTTDASRSNMFQGACSIVGDEASLGLAKTTDAAGRLPASGDRAEVQLSLGLAMTTDAQREPALERRLGLADTTESSGARRRELGPLPPGGGDGVLKGLVFSSLFKAERSVQIGRFQILQRLGEGGMGTVYAAYDEQLDRKVAVKVLREETARGSTTGRARLLREAQAMARLSHPNIVAVHEAGEADGQIFVAMEFVRGQSLDRWIAPRGDDGVAGGPRPWRVVLEVFIQAGRGLAAAHAAGIVHRDFKPHNTMVGDDGVVKVLDFGLARALDGRVDPATASATAELREGSPLRQALTRTGALMGTPAYMSPEQHRGAVADARSDQFSFCVALYEALYGEHPFPCSSLLELVSAVTEGRVRDAPVGARVPGWLHRQVVRGMAVEPDDRHASMRALLDALARDPAARRRRWIAAAGFTLAATTGGFALAQLGDEAPAEPCAGVGQELAEVWSDARRDALASAMAGAGVDYASDLWTRVEPQLAGYADAWLEARGEACERHASGLESSRLYDLGTACLERRRASLESLIGLIEQVDKDGVDKVPLAVAGLPKLERCSDAEALTAELPPPDDAGVKAAVAERRATLASAREHEAMGLYELAIEQANDVLTSPAAGSYAPLRAEALLRRGATELELSRPRESAASLSAALELAMRLDHHAVAAEAFARRIYVEGELLGEPDLAMRDAPLARAVASHELRDGRLQWLLLNNLGAVHLVRGEHDEAARHFEDALEVRAAMGEDGHPEYAYTLENLGVLAVSRGQTTRAAERFTRALSILEAALGPYHPHAERVHGNIGFAERYADHLDEARRHLRLAVASSERRFGASSLELLEPLMLLGHCALELREYAEAVSTLERAARVLEAHELEESEDAVEPLISLSRALASGGQRARAQELYERARAIAARSSTPGRAVLFELSLGRWALEHGSVAEAITRFERAVADEGLESSSRAIAHNALARALQRDGQPGRALTHAQRSAELWREAGVVDGLWIAKAERTTGELHHELGQPELARAALERAVGRLDAQHRASHPFASQLQFELARLLPAGRRAEALALAREASDRLAERPGFSDMRATIDAWLASAE